jgi:tRNA-2-methylthio-N6-dimethylallyladenosine synthase
LIAGFPGEREEDFEDTLSLMREVRYDSGFMFKYSPREGTAAAALEDDVPAETKQRRLEGIVALQRELSEEVAQGLCGSVQEVLVEESAGNGTDGVAWKARTRTGKTVLLDSAGVGPGAIALVRLARRRGLIFQGELLETVSPGR